MAQHLVSTITISADNGTWTAGDKVETFWDTSTEDFVVKKNDSVITTGNVFSGTLKNLGNPHFPIWSSAWCGTYWSRTMTNYFYNNTGNDILFHPFNSFPYVIEVESLINTPGEEQDDEVNDLELTITTVTNATGTTATGEIVATARGTNTPFTYSLSNFQNDEGQSSGTFSSLVPGTYTVTARDSAGYLREANVEILSDVIVGNYGNRWEFVYLGPNSEQYQVEIKERDYSGGSTTLTEVGPTPFSLTMRGEGKDFYENAIIPGTAQVQLESTTTEQFAEIGLADDEQFKVVHSKWNGSSYDTQWQGFVTPSQYSEFIYHPPYVTTIIAHDRLGDLKNIEFKRRSNIFFDFGIVTGQITELQALVIALENLNLNQGFRIATNIFDSSHSTTNNTPQNQTQFEAEIFTSFIKEETDLFPRDVQYTKCDQVIKAILNKYGAEIRSWDGYWNIRRKKEMLSATINYVEYSRLGTYVTTGSWTPRVSFKDNDSSDKFRWQGGAQSYINTKIFKNVTVNITGHINEKGILRNYVTKIQDSIENNPNGYGYFDEGTSNTYRLYNDSVTFDRNDKFRLTIEYLHSLLAHTETTQEGNKPPYIPMKWMLKVGTKYLDVGGNWSTTETINEHFITDYGKDSKFEFTFSPDDVNVSTLNYRLRVYIPNIHNYNISEADESTMLTSLKDNIDTTSLQGGTRKIARVGNGVTSWKYYYYELRDSAEGADEPYRVRPTDYNVSTNAKVWYLVTNRFYAAEIVLPVSTHKFNSIQLHQLPGGEEPKEELPILSTSNTYNKIDYDFNLSLFDADGSINNEQNIYRNVTRYTDGSTLTGTWTESGGTVSKTIQRWQLDWLMSMSNRARRKVNGKIHTDTNINPLSVLIDPGTNNMLFDLSGVTFNWKENIHEGEIIEIGSDNSPETSAFTTGFENNAFR